jgi:hypothetical protein
VTRARVWIAVVLCAALAAAGCSRQALSKGSVPVVNVTEAKEMAPARGNDRRATLATTRHVELQVAPDAVAPLFTSLQAACVADAAGACVVMSSNLDTGDYATAQLTLRATPAGIARLLARLHSDHGFVGESTSSEDLAAPIVDTDRQIAMAREYRDSLLALRAKGGNDIKALMSVNEELARVQSQLESATGERAHLQQRIDTETLTIAITSTGERATHAWRSISQALHEFGTHLADAAASAITFIAYAIPWTVVLLPLAWLLRWLWRRRRSAR